MALTDLKVWKAKAEAKAYKIYDSLGLFVLVKPNGSKLWRQTYKSQGKERLLAHGSYPDVSLREAREKRDAVRAQMADGIDPEVQRKLDQIEAETLARTDFLLIAEGFPEPSRERGLAEAAMRKKE